MKRLSTAFPYVLTLAISFGIPHISPISRIPQSVATASSFQSPQSTEQFDESPGPVIANSVKTTVRFEADIKAGLIGTTEDQPVDYLFDNVFHIKVDRLPSKNEVVYLRYELQGVADHRSVARSINDGLAIGGLLVNFSKGWSSQSEIISTSSVKIGDNVIRFGIESNANHHYWVRNVALVIEKRKAGQNQIIINQPDRSYAFTHAYIKGILATAAEKDVTLYCDNQPVTVVNNEFELIVNNSTSDSGSFSVELKAESAGRTIATKKVQFEKTNASSIVNNIRERGKKTERYFVPGKPLQFALVEQGVSAHISIPAAALSQTQEISITPLSEVDMPGITSEIVNVTAGASGYRFLPHGSQFAQQAQVAIPFDSCLIPEGYTAHDIRTYFFDELARQWTVLRLDSLMIKAGMVFSSTTHFTDMINGIIKVPESPQTMGYTPTSIKDLKAADPSSGIVQIDPPTANNTGAAVLSFPLKLPAGRQGMQPNLSVQYNSEGGNGWMGLGWNLTFSSIGIETRWGVPRYDEALETETYLLGGEQMSPIAHRGSFVARTNDKRFHLRVEGSFNRIIRHGTSPKNYWWEVINKDGTRHFYGSVDASNVLDAAVLKDEQGNIGQWALVESRDLNDNFVRYEYDKVNHVGVGSSPGQQLYLKTITYTGHGSTIGLYRVDFVRDQDRKDIEISARLGFKVVTADRLRRINVSYEAAKIRSYDFKYKEGAFLKTLLTGVSELDDRNEVFYKHDFSYYDDVNSSGSYELFGPEETWSIENNNIKGDIVNPLPGFTGEGSALFTSKSNSNNAGLTVTIGTTVTDFWSKAGTIGGSFGYGEDNQDGLVSMVDINGDGLPDKVLNNNGALAYGLNLGGTQRKFETAKPISGAGSFSKSQSKNVSWGVQIVPPFGFLGFNETHTTTSTTDFFEDFNGDGLIDIGSNGQVLFNRRGSDGNPVFLPTSEGTASEIISGSAVDETLLTPDTELQSLQEQQFPLQDIVRFWQAPFDGVVAIDAPVRLVESPIKLKKDGVRVSIQAGSNQLWSTTIPPIDYSTKIPLNVNNINVQKGQRIYFRVQSIYNGEDDIVNWDPIIRYLDPALSYLDANSKNIGEYKASEDFILHNDRKTRMMKDGVIEIDGQFSKGITSDGIKVQVIKYSNNVKTVVFEKDFGTSALSNEEIVASDIQVKQNDSFEFRLHSDSYIDRTKLSWIPRYFYVSFADNTPVKGPDGKPTIEQLVVPDNSNYNDVVKRTPILSTAQRETIAIIPVLSGPPSATGRLSFTVKGKNKVYVKYDLQLTNGVITSRFEPVWITREPADFLFCEYATADRKFALSLRDVRAKKINQATRQETIIEAGLYTEPEVSFLGSLFRGWGNFVLKGDKGDGPIDQSKLNLEELNDFPTDPEKYKDPSTFKELKHPGKTDFVMLLPDPENKVWMAYDAAIYVAATTMSSSRLWMHDVTTDRLIAGSMQGAALGTVVKVSKTEVQSYSLGASGGPGGSLSGGISNANTVTMLDVMDANGDRYPDVISENNIQYTFPSGGLENASKSTGAGKTENIGSSSSISLGGKFPEAATKQTTAEAARQSHKSANVGIGVSGNLGANDDHSASSWIDINGDNLPDKVETSGNTALNLGYRFSNGENWNTGTLDKNKSESLGGGVGINLNAGSFEAGFGLSRTNSKSETMFMDMNGDGFPEKLIKSSNQLQIYLNTGNAFELLKWNGTSEINTNVSTGESINLAYTYAIPVPFLPIKICINPSFSTGHGVARRLDQIMDINGDGYADLLYSENDGHLVVRPSLIGRTNLLQTVLRPLGGSFTVDYQRIGNTYDLPQNKWVLDRVEFFDGLSGDGADYQRSRFSYEGGFYNRDEREFFGFHRVKTHELDSVLTVYRTQVQQFSVADFYTKGLLLNGWLEDADGFVYQKISHEYRPRPVGSFSYFPSLEITEEVYGEKGSPSVIKTMKAFNYDDYGNVIDFKDRGDMSQPDMIFTKVTYHDRDAEYIKSIPASVVVTTIEGEKRRSTTRIDDKGDVTQISQYLAGGPAAEHNMEYDRYGNLSKIIRPENHDKKRMWFEYTYDEKVHTYVTSVKDAFGYNDSSRYDYHFGALLSTLSMNKEPMLYTLDNRGRLVTVTGPYELEAGKLYTIKFEYYPNAPVPYAITRHYDPEHGGDINTISFIDGAGRSVQVKKDVSLFKGKSQQDELKMVVSGKTMYDEFGRALKNSYPVVEDIGTLNIKLSTKTGLPLSSTKYDVQDRPIESVLADSATTINEYEIKDNLFVNRTIDALKNKKETHTDIRKRVRLSKELSGPGGGITTSFHYNALSELIGVVDNNRNKITTSYDNLGRQISVHQPDAGLTEFEYDAAGNLTRKITAQIRKDIPQGGAIEYEYEYERLISINYPRYYQNKVRYVYGKVDSVSPSRLGRLVLQQDASGGQEFFYGKLGEVTKVIRTVLVTPVYAVTYVSEQQYDTWNRLKLMNYPDGDSVKYHYNKAGGLLSVDGAKLGRAYKYVDQLGYDEYEQRVYLRYGNGTETHYSYDNKRRLLSTLKASTSEPRLIMNNKYWYDKVNNILEIVNDISAVSAKLGGYARQEYVYDGLYRLDSASGSYRGFKEDAVGYTLKMKYDNLYNIVNKRMVDSSDSKKSYDQKYDYNGKPHQVTDIDTRKFKYDLDGNQLGDGHMENFWDEENRLVGVINNGILSQYTYDASGERAIKSSGGLQGIWVNGAPAGAIRHTDNYVSYVSPYLVCRRTSFTKHIYIEDQRIATKMGNGEFSNISFPQPALTAGGVDYIRRAAEIEQSRNDYYSNVIGLSPGPPTDKYFYARPENSGIAAPVVADTTRANVPAGWPGPPTGLPNGPPIFNDSIPSNDAVKAGFGYRGGGQFYEKDQYFYHPDHLGSTSYVTDALGEVNQHAEYSPFGEIFFDEHISSYTTPYLFNAKEKDVETNYYYFGARYYDSKLSTWLSIDPVAQMYPGLSPYNYVANNPVMNYDPDGRLIGTVIGAAVGTLAGAVCAGIQGKNIWKGAGKGFVAGTIAGAVADLTIATAGTGTVALVGAGILSGAAGNAVDQGLNNLDGTQKGFSFGQLGASAALGGALGYAGAKVAPVIDDAVGRLFSVGRVFWSGGDDAMNAAMSFAKANGMTTLEMTRAGQNLTKLTEGMPWEQARPMWERLSAAFAKGAKGPVHVFQNANTGVGVNSVWRTIEYPILNGKNNIIYHNIFKP